MTKEDFLACNEAYGINIQEDIKFNAATSCLLAATIKDNALFVRKFSEIFDDDFTVRNIKSLIETDSDNKDSMDLSFDILCTISSSSHAKLSTVLDALKACDDGAIDWDLLAKRMTTEIPLITTEKNSTEQCFDYSQIKKRSVQNPVLKKLLDNKTDYRDTGYLTSQSINKLLTSSNPQKIFTGFHMTHDNWKICELGENSAEKATQHLSSHDNFTISEIVKKLLYAEYYLGIEFDYNKLATILTTEKEKKRPHNSEISTPPTKRVRRDTEDAYRTPTHSHASNYRMTDRQTGLSDELLHFLAIKLFNAWKSSCISRPTDTICTALKFSNDDIYSLKSSSIIREKLIQLRSEIGEQESTSELIASLRKDGREDIVQYIERYKPFTATPAAVLGQPGSRKLHRLQGSQ